MRIFQVDAFTDEPFRGNPAAVCLLEEERDDGWRRAVAAEMNVSETAFVERKDDGFGLRWFTPTGVEVDLCGHATLATAHTLWETGEGTGTLRFDTRSGVLTAERDGDQILLDFPAEPAQPIVPPEGLGEALGVEPVVVGANRFDYLVEVATEDEVRQATPDLAALSLFPVRGVMVTAAATSGVEADFVSRFFGPRTGVDEDPVTGSAHCCLGPYWGAKLGRHELTGYQASARGGFVGVRLRGERVVLAGRAVTVLRGELC